MSDKVSVACFAPYTGRREEGSSLEVDPLGVLIVEKDDQVVHGGPLAGNLVPAALHHGGERRRR
jgi:hypothetical protein